MSVMAMPMSVGASPGRAPMSWDFPAAMTPMTSHGSPMSPAGHSRASSASFAELSITGRQILPEQPSIGHVGGMVPLVKLLGINYEDSVIALSASAIAGLAIHASNADAFREAGGTPTIVLLIKEHLGLEVTAAALWAVTSLARHRSNSDALREAGCIQALLAILGSCSTASEGGGSFSSSSSAAPAASSSSSSSSSLSPREAEGLAVQAAAALAAMASCSEANQEAIMDAEGLPCLEALLRGGLGRVGGVAGSAVSGLRALGALIGGPLSRGADRCSDVLRTEHVELVLGLLEAGQAGAPEATEEAARTLEIASIASSKLCGLIFHTPGAVEALVGVVQAGSEAPGAASAAAALGNMVLHLGQTAREAFERADAVAALEALRRPHGDVDLSDLAAITDIPGEAERNAAIALQRILQIEASPQPPPVTSPGGRNPLRPTVSALTLSSLSPSRRPLTRTTCGGEEHESIPSLVNLLVEGTAGFAIVHAAGALADLATADGDTHRIKMFEAGAAHPAVEILKSAAALLSDAAVGSRPPAALVNALRLVAGLSRTKAFAAEIQEAGVVGPLVKLLAGPWGLGSGQATQVAVQSVEALRWLSENKTVQDQVREQGGVPLLVGLLNAKGGLGVDEKTVASAAAALRFLALNNRNRDVIREVGGVPRLVELLSLEPGSHATVQAAAALTNLSRKKRSNMIAIAEAGGISPLVKLLWQGPNSEAAMLSLSALTNLAYTSCNRDAIREAKGIPALVNLLETCHHKSADDHSTLLSQVVAVLGNLAGTSKNREAIRDAGALPLMVALVSRSNNPPELVGLTVSALTLLSLSHANSEAICKEGVVAPLVRILSSRAMSEELTFKAAEAIRVLSSAPANRNALRDASALEALVALLGPVGQPLRGEHRPHNSDLLVEVVLAVRNMVTSTRNQDMVRDLGGVTRLVEILGDPDASTREQLHGVSALINLFAHNSINRDVVRAAGGINAFVTLLNTSIRRPESSNAELTAQAALALGFLARTDSNRDAIRVAGGIPLLVQLLKAGAEAEVTLCAVDAMRHVVATPGNAKALLEAGGVRPLLQLLESGPKHEVTLQSLWVLKVLARSPAAAAAIRTQGGLPFLLKLMESETESEATIQAAAVIRDMADVETDVGLAAIKASGAIPSLVRMLKGTAGARADRALAPAMAAAALANIAQTDENRLAIDRAGGTPGLVALLKHSSTDSQALVKAAAALLNISLCDRCISRVVDAHAVPVLVGLLAPGQDSSVTTWAAAVLASLARTEMGRSAVASAGGVQRLVQLLSLGARSGPARQAAAAVQELACGATVRETLTGFGAVAELLELHAGAAGDDELAECCLQALANLSRSSAARALMEKAGALELLSKRPSSSAQVGHRGSESNSSSSSPMDGGLHHAPQGGWSWQQVGRIRGTSLRTSDNYGARSYAFPTSPIANTPPMRSRADRLSSAIETPAPR